ncbi:MAG TPA: AAA family ATPase, partial [Leptospiraceae bacterium]|nr:AAA family ATPase [Leptospiraceae bacterium]
MIPKASYRQTICFPLAFTDKSEGYGIMKNLPIGRQSFKDIRERNEVYVDKTRYLYALVKNGGVFFLSRPRRFGKSLLISTLNEIFLGNKEAFSGLWMENSDYDWKKYPIIRIDFSKQKAKNTEQLERFIKEQLDYIAEDYGIRLTHQEYFSRFDQLIQLLSKESKIVILIDEYDKPIIDHLENPELAKEMREILKGFYTVIKAGDENLRFVLLTG